MGVIVALVAVVALAVFCYYKYVRLRTDLRRLEAVLKFY